jgi:hypothetical protein
MISLVRQMNTSTPGSAVGIIRNDSLILAIKIGMGQSWNTEYRSTRKPYFHMASISKQFYSVFHPFFGKARESYPWTMMYGKYLKWFS